jgi:hypothetical protein
MTTTPSILIIGVPHPLARAAECDAIDIAHHFLCKGWTVTLATDTEATVHRVLALKADVCWFSGECTADKKLQLADYAISPKLLALGKAITVFDCCHIGSLIKPTGHCPVVCASSGLNWNEHDGSSLLMHAARDLIAKADPDTLILDPVTLTMPVLTFRAIGAWMNTWCDRNSPTTRQAPVMGKL